MWTLIFLRWAVLSGIIIHHRSTIYKLTTILPLYKQTNLQHIIFSCILQNSYEKLDEAYIKGILQQVMLIEASKCSNLNFY